MNLLETMGNPVFNIAIFAGFVVIHLDKIRRDIRQSGCSCSTETAGAGDDFIANSRGSAARDLASQDRDEDPLFLDARSQLIKGRP